MYEMFALVSGELQSDLAEAPADLKDKVMEGIKPVKRKKGIIVSLRPYMTAAACLVLVIGIFAAGRGGFGMSANDTAAPRTAEVNCSTTDSAEEPRAQVENYGYIPEAAEDSVCNEEAPTECADSGMLVTAMPRPTMPITMPGTMVLARPMIAPISVITRLMPAPITTAPMEP